MADPFSNPSSWDIIYFSGLPYIGRFHIKGATRSYKWDDKHTKGSIGYTDTFGGTKPKPFTIEFYITNGVQYLQWQAIVKIFTYGALTPPAFASSVTHPQLSDVGISSVVADSVGAAERIGDDGVYKADLVVREYFPKKPGNATTTPAGATATTPLALPGFTPSPAVLAREQALADVKARAAALGPLGGK